MKNKTSVIMIIIAFSFIAGANQMENSLIKSITNLISENEQERDQASKDILQSRKETINQIENIARRFIADESRKGTAKSSIVLLGELHSVESIPFLAENISFNVFYKENKRPQLAEDSYPCFGALIKIGSYSIPALIKNIKTKDDSTVRELSALAIQSIEGPEVGRVILENAMKKANTQEKTLLNKALELDYFKLLEEK